MRKEIILMLLPLFYVANIYAQDKIVNDPNAEVRKVSGFTGVTVSGAIELYVTQSNEEKVVISARDAEDVAKIETVVENGTLKIRFKNRNNWWGNQWNTSGRKFRAYVSLPVIKKLASAGSGNIYVQGKIKADDLRIGLSGSGNFEGEVEAGKIDVGLSGSSNVRIKGKAGTTSYSISGSGNIMGSNMAADFCDVSISGSGNAELTVNKELSARVSGSGNVRYYGSGLIRSVSTSGSGKVRKVS
ncbi:MAG: head GIN domain-containing protein [Chitinophagaceae bacterium]|nr:head GIN domain-containing protein [Chitinophagaceae bacterium]